MEGRELGEWGLRGRCGGVGWGIIDGHRIIALCWRWCVLWWGRLRGFRLMQLGLWHPVDRQFYFSLAESLEYSFNSDNASRACEGCEIGADVTGRGLRQRAEVELAFKA